MNMEFDKKLMIDNISFLLKECGKRVGELESEAGVSTGYISRTSKDENAKPGIDFIMRVSEALNISLDTLLKVDMTSLTPTERYLVTFFEKLILDTNDDKLEWIQESAESLNRQGNDVMHPLFSCETFCEQMEGEYPEEVTRVVFVSHLFGCNTYIQGPCYNLRLKNGVMLYLMNICKSIHKTNDNSAYAKEVWMGTTYGKMQFICSNRESIILADLVEKLYVAVCENSKHPKLKRYIRDVIDAYMLDDLEDDLELPFS